MSDYDRFTTGVSRRQLGAIYRAFKDGKLDGITQRDISAMYDYFDGYTRMHEGGAWGWDDIVSKMAGAAKNSAEGNYAEAAKTLRAVIEHLELVPSDDALLSALKNAIEKGLITVAKTAAGYSFSGATFDHKAAIKDMYGAKWDAASKSWNVSGSAKELDEFVSASAKASERAAKRASKVATDGIKEFDKQRAAQLLKATKEVKSVYSNALVSSQWELEDVIKRLSSADDPIEAAGLALRRGELESLIDALGDSLAEAGKTAEQVVNGHLVECRKVASNVATWQISNLSGIGFTRFLGDDYMVKALHSKYDKIAWKGVANPRIAKKTIKQQIARGVLVGEHPSKIASRISGLFDGSTPNSGYTRAKRIAQTETCRIMSEAAQDTYKAASDMGIKLRNRWDATLDGKTRKSHRKVDGEIREIGQKFSNGCLRPGDGVPAESINCRCALVPVLDGWKPNAEIRMDNTTKETIPYQTYSEWAKSTSTHVEKLKAQTSKPAISGDVVKVKNDYSAKEIKEAARQKATENKAENAVIIEGIDVERKNGGIVVKAGSEKVTEETFFTDTTAVYKQAKRPSGEPDYDSGSGSRYWYKDGGVYRESDHWGAGVASCDWFLEGRNDVHAIYGSGTRSKSKHTMQEDARRNEVSVGFCKLSDFANNEDLLPTTAKPNSDMYIKDAEEKYGIEYKFGIVYKDGKRVREMEQEVADYIKKLPQKETPVFYN